MMWLEAVLLLAAFLTAIALVLLQNYLPMKRGKRKAKEISGGQATERSRSSDQVYRRIEKIVSKKGKLTVDELSEIILTEGAVIDLRKESVIARLREMEARIAAMLQEMKKRGPPDLEEASSPQ